MTENFFTLSEIIENRVSTKFIYQLSEELERISETDDQAMDSESKKKIFLVEAKRMLSHSDIPEKDRDEKKEIVSKICGDLEKLTNISEFDLKNLLEFLRGITFIARERGAVL